LKKSVSKFLASIDKYAKRKQAEIIEEIRMLESTQLQKAESEIIDDARRLIQAELSYVKSCVMRKISIKNIQIKRKIFKKMQEIEQEVLSICKEEIKNFTCSEAYPKKLELFSRNILKILGDSADIFVRNDDLKYLNIITGVLKNAEVFKDPKIKLGGIIGKKDNVIIDLTFDAALSEFF
jgi:vacuolar-type H+-ATPase subunit E/Vma4